MSRTKLPRAMQAQAHDAGRRRFIEAASMVLGLTTVGCGGGEAAEVSGPVDETAAATDPPVPSTLPVAGAATVQRSAGSALTIARITAATTGTVPFSFGQAFGQGHVAAGDGLQGLQLNVISTWPDGSVRFGIVSGIASVSGGVPQDVPLGTGLPAPGSPLTVADLKALLVKPVRILAGTFGEASWSGKDWDKPFLVWASGPLMSSWVYRKPIGTDAHLVGWLEVRLWRTGAVEVLPWVENGYLLVAGPTNKSARYAFSLGGKERFNAAIDLPHHCRTPLVSGALLSHWLGADPGVVVRHDVAYLQATEMVPSYYATVPANAASVAALPTTFTPLQQGLYTNMMGQGGYQRAIGLLPQWDALYLTCDAPQVWAAIQRQAYSAGRYCIHWRDEATQQPARLADHPNLCLASADGIADTGAASDGVTYTPTPTGTVPPVWDTPHHPSVGYLAALVTGRFYHAETIQFAAATNLLKESDGSFARDGSAGLVKSQRYTTRGAAWAIRTLAQALAISVDGSAQQTELRRVLDNNIAYYHGRYSAVGYASLGFTEPYSDYTDIGSGNTGADSTATKIDLSNSSSVHRDNVIYDNLYKGQKLVIGRETRIVSAYDGMSGVATVGNAFTVGTSAVAFELGDQIWFNANWMQDFFSAAWGYTKALQLTAAKTTELDAFYAWNAQSVIGRLGGVAANEYLFRDAFAYTIAISPSDHTDWTNGTGPWFANWGEVWTATNTGIGMNATYSGPKDLGDRTLRNIYVASTPGIGYPGNGTPAIAYAVRHGVPGAADGLALLQTSPTWTIMQADWATSPEWGIMASSTTTGR